ncbi:hypothetical protein OAR80_05245 [Methylophilaceae bacterium]|nr:hypothetical protein [Methylophilaceae bacterium]
MLLFTMGGKEIKMMSDMSLENIFGAVVLIAVGLVILLHPDKFRYSSKQIKQFIFRYWWISVFVLLGYLTMGEWSNLFMA